LLRLEFLFGEGVPRKESPHLGVPPLEHQNDLPVGPVIHRDAPDLRDGHPQASVAAAAPDADQCPVADRRPLGIQGVAAIDAISVAGKGVQQHLAGDRKGLPVGWQWQWIGTCSSSTVSTGSSSTASTVTVTVTVVVVVAEVRVATV